MIIIKFGGCLKKIGRLKIRVSIFSLFRWWSRFTNDDFFFAKHDFSMIIQISKKKHLLHFFSSLSKSLFEKITLFSPNSTQMWLNKKWPEFFFSNSNLCLFVWLFIYLHIIIIIFKSNNRKTDKFSKTKEKNKTRGSSLVKCFFFFWLNIEWMFSHHHHQE